MSNGSVTPVAPGDPELIEVERLPGQRCPTTDLRQEVGPALSDPRVGGPYVQPRDGRVDPLVPAERDRVEQRDRARGMAPDGLVGVCAGSGAATSPLTNLPRVAEPAHDGVSAPKQDPRYRCCPATGSRRLTDLTTSRSSARYRAGNGEREAMAAGMRQRGRTPRSPLSGRPAGPCSDCRSPPPRPFG